MDGNERKLAPLVRLWTRQRDEWNPWDFNLSIGPLHLWSAMAPQLGAELILEDLGLFLFLRLPYLHVQLTLLRFPFAWHQRLWRKGTADDGDE